jgi:hypothetical protein
VQESVRHPDFSGVGRCRCQQPCRRRRCGNVEPGFGAGFQARWDEQQNHNLRPRFRYRFPTERHFHSERGILPILVRFLSLVEPNDQNVRFQKPAQNEHFYRLSARAHFLPESEGLRRLLPRLYPRPLALCAAAIFLQEAA